MKKKKEITKALIEFINESPCAFHVIENVEAMLDKEGFTSLSEKEEWNLEWGRKYYVNRNQSSFIAFKLPDEPKNGFQIIASHSDSPSFKIKETPEILIEDNYTKLNVEKYGGMILSSWFDRPLSVAGRIVIEENGRKSTKLVNIKKDLFIIPNLAIHMTRDQKKEADLNPQVDMLPLFGGKNANKTFLKMIAREVDVKADEILGTDLYLYNRQRGLLFGSEEEFIGAPRLDDLQCVFASTNGFIQAEKIEKIAVLGIFDNEEVGSSTMQGADSTFLEDVLSKICYGLELGEKDYKSFLRESFMVSADNAHGVHPNHPEIADPTNRPYLNKGIVIKFHGGQKYSTDALSGAVIKSICKKAKIPYQTYQNRSDLAGGSTLGNISNTHVSIPTADIGLPQLAMHSAFETAGTDDTKDMITFAKTYFESCQSL